MDINRKSLYRYQSKVYYLCLTIAQIIYNLYSYCLRSLQDVYYRGISLRNII